MTDKNFWEKRATSYNKLQWASQEEYISSFLEMCAVGSKDSVLDLGTGTGTIAYALSHRVKNVIGVDISMAMLHEAQKNNIVNNIQFMKADVRYLPFLDNSFTLVTARMVFHHILAGLMKAAQETYRVLKSGGRFCLSEGVPPHRCVGKFYNSVFKLKEKRRTFFPEDLGKLLKEAGFRNIQEEEHIMKHCSIRNWLDNAGNLSPATKEKIYSLHLNLHEEGKRVYNMKITPKDCFIDMKFSTIKGIK